MCSVVVSTVLVLFNGPFTFEPTDTGLPSTPLGVLRGVDRGQETRRRPSDPTSARNPVERFRESLFAITGVFSLSRTGRDSRNYCTETGPRRNLSKVLFLRVPSSWCELGTVSMFFFFIDCSSWSVTGTTDVLPLPLSRAGWRYVKRVTPPHYRTPGIVLRSDSPIYVRPLVFRSSFPITLVTDHSVEGNQTSTDERDTGVYRLSPLETTEKEKNPRIRVV